MIHVIDDDEAVRTSLLFVLEMVGYGATGYANADDFFARGRNAPGILICDVRMPGRNGIELTRLLRQSGSTTPIILMTGNASPALKAEAISAGASHVLEKPVALRAILEEIALH